MNIGQILIMLCLHHTADSTPIGRHGLTLQEEDPKFPFGMFFDVTLLQNKHTGEHDSSVAMRGPVGAKPLKIGPPSCILATHLVHYPAFVAYVS